MLQTKRFNRPASRSVDTDSTIGDGDDSMTSATMTSKQNSEDEEGSGNESDGGGKNESFNDAEVSITVITQSFGTDRPLQTW